LHTAAASQHARTLTKALCFYGAQEATVSMEVKQSNLLCGGAAKINPEQVRWENELPFIVVMYKRLTL
jgi:hypothetical protein